MQALSITTIKAHLNEVIEQVQEGDEFIIMRRGVPVARISAISSKRKPLPLEELQSFRDSIPKVHTPTHVLLRQLRDEGY